MRWAWLSVLMGGLLDVFESADHALQVGVDLAVICCQPAASGGFGGGDEFDGLVTLVAVDV